VWLDKPLEVRADDRLSYETSCETSTPGSFAGYVLNKSGDNYQINGMVSFIFSMGGPDNQRAISVPGHAFVAAHQKALVAETAAPFVLTPGEFCRFDVSGAIRKLP
jgi:hypothetical protein